MELLDWKIQYWDSFISWLAVDEICFQGGGGWWNYLFGIFNAESYRELFDLIFINMLKLDNNANCKRDIFGIVKLNQNIPWGKANYL